jgi:outer membrane receptor protein involved in Fe transport
MKTERGTTPTRTPSVVPSDRSSPRIAPLWLLVVLIFAAASRGDEPLPEAPTREPTPEEMERDRLLEIASHEAYLDSDEDRLCVASGAVRRAESTPFAVTVVTGARLREMAYTTLADALVGLAGLYPDWRYRMGQYAGVGVRCSPTRRVEVLIDGMPVDHGLTWFEALSTVPLNLVRRVEILRGPGGGLYASGLGGVINVVTRNPQRLTLALAEAAGGSGSFNNQRYWGRFANTLWIVQYKVGGYKWSHIGGMDEFERDGGSLDAEVRFDLEGPEPGEFVRGAQIGLYARTFYARAGDRWSLDMPLWQDNVNMYHYGAFTRFPLGGWGDWRLDVRYSETERSRFAVDRDYRFQRDDQRELGASYYTTGSVDVATRLDALPWEGARLGVLLDGFWEESEALEHVGPYNLGAALQLEQGLFGGMTQFVGGARVDRDERYGTTPTFRCGLLQGFAHAEGTDSIFLNYADGFRRPTEDELNRRPDLEPEVGWELEGGVRLSSPAPLTCQLTAFYREVSDAILPGDAVYNSPEVTPAYGGELELALGPSAEPYLHRATAGSAPTPVKWDFPLNLRTCCSVVWDGGLEALSGGQPYLMALGSLGYVDTFFQNDLTVSGEIVLTYLNERPNLAYPGEPSVEPDPTESLEHLNLDLYLRARVIDFDVSFRLNNLIGESRSYSTAGRLTEPIGFALTLSWAFYD